jgi:O-antigen/teichoic acid export membrane protein
MWKAGVASADQAMLSALSFVVSIILIQSVPKSEFGYYSIALAISLFLSSVQNAVVNAPLAVLLVNKKDTDRRQYAASLCFGQFLAILPAVCLSFVAIRILKSWGSDITQLSIAAALSSAVAGLLFREFLRSYMYAEEAPVEVLKLDILYVAVFMGLLALTHLLWEVSAATVFVQMGVSSMLVSLIFSRNRGWEFRQEEIRKSYRENWIYGKWALLGVCVTHAQNYSYLYLLGAISGSMAVADVSAARLLLMPLMLVRMGWGKIAIPHGSILREEGQIHRFFKEQIVSSVVFLLVVAIYVVLVLAFSGVLQNYLLSEKYANSFQYVVIWGGIVVAGFIAMNASYGLQVMMGFSTITKISFFVMIVTVGSAYFLIRGYGIAGGLTALLIGQIVLAVCLWIPFGKIVFSVRKRQADALLEKEGTMKLSENPP